jgi:hypothetical protein
MATTALTLDPADLYLARLGTDHSRRTARSALTTVAALLGVDAIDWSAITYAELALVRGMDRNVARNSAQRPGSHGGRVVRGLSGGRKFR